MEGLTEPIAADLAWPPEQMHDLLFIIEKPKRGRPRRSEPSPKTIAKRRERERATIYGKDYVLRRIVTSNADWIALGLEAMTREEQDCVLQELWAECIAHVKKMR